MMGKIKKIKAIAILSELADAGERIKNLNYDSPEVAEWENKIESAILNIFDESHLDKYKRKFNRVYSLSIYGDNGSALQKYHREDVDTSVPFLKSLIDEIENFWAEDTVSDNSTNSTENNKIIQIIDRFHLITKQLRQRHDSRETLGVSDEYDVQDLFHALLKLYFDDIRAEEWTPSYAGSSSRIDFFIPELELAIEIKKTRKGLGNKEAKEQLAIDKDHYRCKENIKHLICFVYDPDGKIQNPRGFEKGLAQDGPLKTDVYVRP